jgi:hypothetical protein
MSYPRLPTRHALYHLQYVLGNKRRAVAAVALVLVAAIVAAALLGR